MSLKESTEVKALDLMVLLYHAHRAATDPLIGYEDANTTIDELTRKLTFRNKFDVQHLESALWSCNLMDEKGQFWSPFGLSFKDWVVKAFPGYSFDTTYNTLEKK